MNVTAVVLSAKPYARAWPGLQVLVHESVITSADEHQAARFDAVAKVRTPFWFWLDDDDDLPADYLDVIAHGIQSGADLVYTDERVISAGAPETVRQAGPYSPDAHIVDPLLVHHLALYRTTPSRQAIERLPRGHYWPEMQLSFEVAKAGDVAYLPRIGYHWHRGSSGLHKSSHTAIAIVRTQLWCKEHRA